MNASNLTDGKTDSPRKRQRGGGGQYPQRWIRLPTRGRCPDTGLTRPAFYALIHAGKVRSACLRRPGAVRGTRLVWLPSVMALLDHAADTPDPSAEAEAARLARLAQKGVAA